MRLDRIVTMGVIRRLRRISSAVPGFETGRRRPSRRLPILMYHSISNSLESDTAPYFRTATSPERFQEHMRFLKLRGWRGVSLQDGLRIQSQQPDEEGSEMLFALTFDDGFRDFLTSAIPVLNECGYGATMFLPTAFVADSQCSDHFRGRDCLTWSDVQALHSGGIEFGSHTVSHPILVELAWPRVESELADSKAAIEANLQSSISSFSYPFAFPQADRLFCARLRALLIAIGYKACVTTTIGCSSDLSDPYSLRRLPVNNDDDVALLAAKLEGDYDWLAVPQKAYKAIKRISRGLKRRHS
jgi:peptidoglycan/xylan/chitin deacetylase (PgdA/CDA1 family)